MKSKKASRALEIPMPAKMNLGAFLLKIFFCNV